MRFSPKKKNISTNVKRLLFSSILHTPGTNAVTTYTSEELDHHKNKRVKIPEKEQPWSKHCIMT